MPPNRARGAGNQAASSAAWHVRQALEAQDSGDRIREDLKCSFRVDQKKYEKRRVHLKALKRRIAENEASIRSRRFVVDVAAMMKRRPNSGAKAYLTNAEARRNEQMEELKRLKRRLQGANTSWIKYFRKREAGREDQFYELARAAQKVQYHVVQVGNLESPTEAVLKLLGRSEALLTGPYHRATKGPVWKMRRLDFTIDPKHFPKRT